MTKKNTLPEHLPLMDEMGQLPFEVRLAILLTALMSRMPRPLTASDKGHVLRTALDLYVSERRCISDKEKTFVAQLIQEGEGVLEATNEKELREGKQTTPLEANRPANGEERTVATHNHSDSKRGPEVEDKQKSGSPLSSPPQKYWYRDFENREQLHWTCARFMGWTRPTGLLHVPYAIFLRNSGEELLVPRYLLTRETCELLLAIPQEEVRQMGANPSLPDHEGGKK